MRNLICDTETTGLVKHPLAKDDVQPRCIEFAGVITDERGEVLAEKVWLINPGMEIEEEITKITGITNEMLQDAPSFDSVRGDLEGFLEVDHIIAHNLPFDMSILQMEWERRGLKMPTIPHHTCTVEQMEPIYGFRPRLTILYEDLIGKPLAQTHRALDDVHALVEVCRKMGVLK